MSSLKIYNSLSREKEVFEPQTPGYVGLYVCGPTVSGESHLGHARPYITFDVVYRYLLHLGYKVRYVRNITDAGHFEEEGREAEDKVSTKAQIEKLEPMELVQKYTRLFHWGMEQFNNLEPHIEPTATGHIVEQIDMIEKIMARGYAYEVEGSVYFDVPRYAADFPYGKLSGRILDDLLANTRELEGQSEKRHPADFALWKKAPPAHIMRWTSPWGEGFPGWHIECSAMSRKYLGETFDIHGGGMDLQFPHHESEIAQSTIAHGHPPVRYWMHNNMITIDGRKMGKSYQNVIKLTELFSGTHPALEQAYDPMVIRFYILQTHYRSTLDFSNTALQGAQRALSRLWEAYTQLQAMEGEGGQEEAQGDRPLDARIETAFQGCREAMDDDFHTSTVIAHLFDMVSLVNGLADGHIPRDQVSDRGLEEMKTGFRIYIEDILGLRTPGGPKDDKLNQVLDLVLDLRSQARERKDYASSDLIRDRLEALGIRIKDEKGGGVSYHIE